jgi:DNA-binding response OmpR family regulator
MSELKILKELTVLYVDDDKEACETLQHILAYYFKDVFIAYNGQEALNMYYQNTCHLLIVDYDMPIMDGYEFLSKVRENDDEIPALMLSSYDDKIKLKNAITLNLLEYIVKPYELDKLQNVLKKYAQHVRKKGLLKYQITSHCFYDTTKKIILEKEKEHKLTAFEVKLFELLLKNRQKVISYDELLDILNSANQKSLISMIHKLKKKLPNGIIENIKDIGYILH